MDEQGRKTIAITGSHGLVGQRLVRVLAENGYRPIRVVRGEPEANEIGWDPRGGGAASEGEGESLRGSLRGGLAGVDAVVHLAGESILGLWTDKKKRRIERSRSEGTRTLAEAIASLPMDDRPGVLVSASAMGYYGDTDDTLATEEDPPGDDFLARVCEGWEQGAQPAADAGVRVVHPRIGLVLAPDGGALALMRKVFQFGIGGRIGDGQQWVSWVGLDDVVGVILRAIRDPTLRGPVNTVAPEPVRHADLVHAVGRVMRRPTAIPMPAWLARLVMGEVADEMLLKSARLDPAVLRAIGYRYRQGELEATLREML